MEEVGLGKVVEKVRESVEGLSREIFPDLVSRSSGLDSAKAFTVEYDAEEEEKDKELSTHFDNAEVSGNLLFLHLPSIIDPHFLMLLRPITITFTQIFGARNQSPL